MPRKRRAARQYRELGDVATAVKKRFRNHWAWVDPELTLRRLVQESGLPAAEIEAGFQDVFGNWKAARETAILRLHNKPRRTSEKEQNA